MKKKLLLAIAISIFLVDALNAQIEKKDWLLGGSLSINASNGNGSQYSNSNSGISPHVAYAIGKNSTIGLNFNLNYTTSSSDYKYLSFSTNLLYRKYFVIKDKVGWYTQFSGGIGWSQATQTYTDQGGQVQKSKIHGNLYTAAFVPGIYYRVSPGILINADCGGLGYNHTNYGYGTWSSNLNVNFLNSFSFGIDFIIGKHRS